MKAPNLIEAAGAPFTGRPLFARVGGDATLDAACEMTIRRRARADGSADALNAVDPWRAQAALREGLRLAARGFGDADRFAGRIGALTGEVATRQLIETLLASIAVDLLTLDVAAADVDELMRLVRPRASRPDGAVGASSGGLSLVQREAPDDALTRRAWEISRVIVVVVIDRGFGADEPVVWPAAGLLSQPIIDAAGSATAARAPIEAQPSQLFDRRGQPAGLPVEAVTDIADGEAVREPKAAAVARAPPPACLGRLLIVDQIPSYQRRVRPLLARAGYDVVVAAGPGAALDRHDAGDRFDLILADTSAAGLKARRLVEALGRALGWHATPLLGLGSHLSGAGGLDEAALLKAVAENLNRVGGDVAEPEPPRRAVLLSPAPGPAAGGLPSARVANLRRSGDDASGGGDRRAWANRRGRLVRR